MSEPLLSKVALKIAALENGEFSQSVDLKEYPHEVLRLKVCRSFRADLTHKLRMILQAHGRVLKAAEAVRVSPRTFRYWLAWRSTPKGRVQFERIDDAYQGAIARIAAARCKRRRRGRPRSAPHACSASDIGG